MISPSVKVVNILKPLRPTFSACETQSFCRSSPGGRFGQALKFCLGLSVRSRHIFSCLLLVAANILSKRVLPQKNSCSCERVFSPQKKRKTLPTASLLHTECEFLRSHNKRSEALRRHGKSVRLQPLMPTGGYAPSF